MSPIEEILSELITTEKSRIAEWFIQQYQKTSPFFYSSVDIRHSGHKIVPVDTNIFPAGFNLLHDSARQNAVIQFKQHIQTFYPTTQKILLIPENHTRNTFYLENIFQLKTLLENAGAEVIVGGLETEEVLSLTTAADNPLTIHPTYNEENTLRTADFNPDLVIVNNDFSSGAPQKLQNLNTPVIPPVGMGWYKRSKTHHFEVYNEVAREFCLEFNLDPWLISSVVSKCGEVSFKDKMGMECIAYNVDKTISKIKKKYDEYGIKDEPYVFIKSDNGTYGMGIMTAKSGSEVLEINKKIRNKMNSIKEGVITSEVIIQEGIPTIDKVNDLPAEPMVYLANGKTIGCTYRINENRDAYSNLNSQGMTFGNACEKDTEASSSKQCPILTFIAELASVAATRECYEPAWQI